jgi:hypothetical protein
LGLYKTAKFLGGLLLGFFVHMSPRLVGTALLWFNGLAFCFELLGDMPLFSVVGVVVAVQYTVVGIVIGIALVVAIAAILLLGRCLLVLAIGHDGGLTVHCFGGFKVFHEVHDFTRTDCGQGGSQFCSSILICQCNTHGFPFHDAHTYVWL